MPNLVCPVPVWHSEDDGLCTESWAPQLAELARDGRLVTVPDPHTFFWRDPSLSDWCETQDQLSLLWNS
jgi:hypothetical protein